MYACTKLWPYVCHESHYDRGYEITFTVRWGRRRPILRAVLVHERGLLDLLVAVTFPAG